MAQFHEVIKKFNKIRIYLKDFLDMATRKESSFLRKVNVLMMTSAEESAVIWENMYRNRMGKMENKFLFP